MSDSSSHTPVPPPTPSPPAQADPLTQNSVARVFDLGSGIWANVGLIVFLSAAVGAIIIVIFLAFLGDGSATDYRVFRGLEIVLSVAALGLIATLMGRTANVFALVVGFLVISALVIPTRDLVRITLIASGSDKSLDHYYGSAGVASNLTGRVADTSRNVIDVIDDALHFSNVSLPREEMARLQNEIESVLQQDRIVTLLERIKARGILELLEAIESDNTEAFLYRHSQNDRLQRDLQFLRYEGLISVAYDQVSTATVTQTGRDVLQYSRGLDEQAERITTDTIDRFLTPYPSCTDLTIGLVNDLPVIDLGVDGFSVALVDEPFPVFYKLRILPGLIGSYSFDLRSNTQQFDPLLSVLSYDGDAARMGQFVDCTTLYRDDDSGDNLNSSITEELETGYYIIGLGTLSDTGLGEFIVRNNR